MDVEPVFACLFSFAGGIFTSCSDIAGICRCPAVINRLAYVRDACLSSEDVSGNRTSVGVEGLGQRHWLISVDS